MVTETDPVAQPRIPLSKERVLRAAIKVADEGGIESLTMRKLAEELGVEAMSLYYHVANKEAVLSRSRSPATVTSMVAKNSRFADWCR